jgi:hypothetical protein
MSVPAERIRAQKALDARSERVECDAERDGEHDDVRRLPELHQRGAEPDECDDAEGAETEGEPEQEQEQAHSVGSMTRAARGDQSVHPRAGGEHFFGRDDLEDELGSSPRGRGTLLRAR